MIDACATHRWLDGRVEGRKGERVSVMQTEKQTRDLVVPAMAYALQ